MKKEQLEALQVHLTGNEKKEEVEEQEECRLYDLIDVGLKAGRYIFFGLSYSIIPSEICNDFSLKSYRRLKLFLQLLHICFILFVLIPSITESVKLNPCGLLNMIKKATHIIFQITLVAIHYSFETRGRLSGRGGLLAIFHQCAVVQEKCQRLALCFPSRHRVRRFAWSVAVASCVFCVGRQFLFASKTKPWYQWYAVSISRMMTLGMWTPVNSTVSKPVQQAIGIVGLVFDGIIANYWYFCQFFSFFLVLTAWIIFDRMNKAIKCGKLSIKQLPEVMDLHFHSTKLLNLMNEFVSAMTFWSMAYGIVMMCFWTNYITMSSYSSRGFYVAALFFFLKTTTELLFQADVNSKAHRISDWLEESCTTTESLPQVDPTRLAIFTAQVYNKDCVGFKGFNFFVVTPRLIIPIVGIVVTYTVAVNQFCHTNLN